MENTTLQRRSFDIFKKGHKIFVEGHRGVNREFYQNSMKSFSQAIKYGLDSMELDIWLTKDKIPVILHGGNEGQLYEHIKDVDKNLIVNNITLEELLKLKLKEKDDQTVPTFEEVLNLCKDKIFINVEIKDLNTAETFREVIKLIEEKK